VDLGIEPALPALLDRGELGIQSGQSNLNTARLCLTLWQVKYP